MAELRNDFRDDEKTQPGNAPLKDGIKSLCGFEGVDAPGYPKLADLMARYGEAAIFRRFRSLNLFVLMSLQAELVELEERLRELLKAFENDRPFLLQDFFELSTSSGDDELRELVDKIKAH